MPKRVSNDGAQLRGLAPGDSASNLRETSQWWRAVSDTASDLTGAGVEPQMYILMASPQQRGT